MAAEPTPRFRVALLLSVVLNVLLAAMLAGGWMQHERGRGMGGAVRMPRAETLARVLPESDRAALDAAYERHRPQVRASFRAMREAKREVRAALNARPYDGARLAAALAAMRSEEARVAEAVHALLADVSGNVSDEGRAAVARLVTSRRFGHPRRDRDRESRREPEPGVEPDAR